MSYSMTILGVAPLGACADVFWSAHLSLMSLPSFSSLPFGYVFPVSLKREWAYNNITIDVLQQLQVPT